MEEIPHSIRFAVSQGGIILVEKIFDSQFDAAAAFATKCSEKSIFCVCEAVGGEVYAGFQTHWDAKQTGWFRDDHAFFALGSRKKIYRPTADEKERFDLYSGENHSPAWGGGFNLFFGKMDSNFSGAYCKPRKSYVGCDFPQRDITVQRLRVYFALCGAALSFNQLRRFFVQDVKPATHDATLMTRFFPIMMVADELAAFQGVYNRMADYIIGQRVCLQQRDDVNSTLSFRKERTVSIVPGTLKSVCELQGMGETAPFLVLEVSGCTKEHAELVASLFSDDSSVFNHNRMRCLRVIADCDKTAELGAEVARMCPKHLEAIEFYPSVGDTIPASAYDIITSVPANHKLNVKLFAINSQSSAKMNLENTMNAIRTNPGVNFVMKPVCPSFLEREALKRLPEIPDVDLPAVVPSRDVKWDEMFGFATSQGVVRCDFKDLHKHSVTLQNMYDPAKDGKEPTEPLEKYSGSSVAVRTVAVQLVVLFVSAKDNKGKTVFVSEEATKDAKENPTTWRFSLSDQKFLSYITANSNDQKDEMLLCGEILGIASFLHMPTLQQLIRMHLALLCR